jgi:hypothetical protein
MEFFHFMRQDGTAAATEYFDMPAPVLLQQVLHVLEKLHMATLVRRNGNALRIFLDGAFHDLGNGPVMAQVDDLGSLALQDAPHDIDGCIMTVKKAGGRNDADLVLGVEWHGNKLTSVRKQR